MVRRTLLLLATLLMPHFATAQDKAVVEIGTRLGVAIQSSGGSTLTHFGVPGQGILGQPTIYATFFAGSAVLIEPQVAFNLLSSEGETATTVGLGTQLGYLFNGPDVNSAFLAAELSLQTVSSRGSSNSDFALGGTFGYRILAGTSVGVRFEGGYRRWFDSDLNVFTFGMAIGGIVRRTQ